MRNSRVASDRKYRGTKISAIKEKHKIGTRGTIARAGHNQYYKNLLEKAHKDINVGYDSAIRMYEDQKNTFLEQLKAQGAQQDVLNNLLDNINKTALDMANQDDGTANKIFESVEKYFTQNIVNTLNGDNVAYNELIAQMEKRQKKGQIEEKKLYDNMIKDLERYIEKVTQKNYTDIKTELAKMIGTSGNKSNAAVGANLGGYLRRLILRKIGNFTNETEFKQIQQHYVISLKGFLKEQALAQAFSSVFKQFNIKAYETGSVTNSSGTQMKFDLILGNQSIKYRSGSSFENLLRRYAAIEGTYYAEGCSEIYGGVQSKSWVTPFDRLGNKKVTSRNKTFLDFGNRSDLLPVGRDKYYWHAGVSACMLNLTSAIGYQNFIFSTGDDIYWTADLLRQFREQGYVLGFHYSYVDEMLSKSGSMSMHLHNDNG